MNESRRGKRSEGNRQRCFVSARMLADLGRALNSAIAGLNGNSAIDEAVSNAPFPFFDGNTQFWTQALDLSLRSIAAALLSSDVNVLLVKKLRESVKGKVLPQLVEIAKKSGDNTAGQRGKAIIQKVSSLLLRTTIYKSA